MMMMALGSFIFELNTLPFEERQHSKNWNHPSSSRVQAMPAYQFTGKGEETCSISGRILPQVGSGSSLDELESLADAGDAYTLVDGAGSVYGRFVIAQITRNGSIFDEKGRPLKTEFTISLTRAPDDLQDLAKDSAKTSAKEQNKKTATS